MIEVENITKVYSNVQVLKGLSFRLEAAEQVVICGPSGSGKSTLLYLLGALDRPSTGQLKVMDLDLGKASDEELALYRNLHVGFVFQFHFLLPAMNAWDNIMLPSRIAQLSSHEQKRVQDRCKNLCKLLALESLLEKYPYELSGGEQQRINIVRAMSLNPKLLLCDEPTGNLDSANSHKVIDLLKTLASENKTTLILVTHDEHLASSFSKKFVIQDGLLV